MNDSVFADRKLIRHNWHDHYSITSSARASSVGGTSRPSALASEPGKGSVFTVRLPGG